MYIWILIAFGLAMFAQSRVQSVFHKYSKVQSRNGRPAAQVAREMLELRGIRDVRVERVAGNLTDHFNPKTGVLALSEGVHDSSSLAALGVAAHEVGHVYQQHEGYLPMRLRHALVPIAQLGSFAAFPLFLLGLFMSIEPFISLGIIIFAAVVLFYLVTLPVEFNASRRAITALADGGYLSSDETGPARKVLSAAGLTYVMAAIQAMLQLVRLLGLAGRRRR